MASYNIQADNVSKSTPKLQRGEIEIISDVAVYYRIGNNPVADESCVLIQPNNKMLIRLPTDCLQLAVKAVHGPGSVVVNEVAKAKPRCSA